MTKTELMAIYDRFEVAKKEYDDYVNQFFTKVYNGTIIQESVKVLSAADFDKIVSIRNK